MTYTIGAVTDFELTSKGEYISPTTGTVVRAESSVSKAGARRTLIAVDVPYSVTVDGVAVPYKATVHTVVTCLDAHVATVMDPTIVNGGMALADIVTNLGSILPRISSGLDALTSNFETPAE